MNKKTGWIISVIVILILILIVLRSQGEDASPIKIGSVSALTGVGVAIGEEEYKGTRLAVDEINKAGGVKGRPLVLISEDVSIDKLKNAGSVANKLVSVDKVVAIVGPQWDEPMLAMLPITEKAQVPLIGPDTTDAVESDTVGTYLFSTWYDNRVGVDAILKYAQEKGLKKIAILRPLNAGFWKFASDLVAANASKYGLTIIDDVDVGNPLATDFRTFITKLKQKNPQAIFFVMADPSQCIFFKQMKEQGFTVPVLATEAAGNNASLTQCASDMSNLYFSTPSVDHAGYKEFEKAFMASYGRLPQFPSAVTAYDAVKVLAIALEKTDGQGGPILQKALSETKGVRGASQPELTFKENGFVITPADAFEMRMVRDGKFVKAE